MPRGVATRGEVNFTSRHGIEQGSARLEAWGPSVSGQME